MKFCWSQDGGKKAAAHSVLLGHCAQCTTVGRKGKAAAAVRTGAGFAPLSPSCLGEEEG